MIDLKIVKEIKIAEGSVKKITNSSGVVLWEVKSTSEQTPCYYVAENVSDLPSTPKYDMAYITSEKCWYALNNKSKWEKYGVIELVSSLDNLTTYDGKLVCNTTDKHEYKYTGGAWSDQGEVSESVVKNYWAECKQNEIELYHITYHWGEGYHIEFEYAYDSTSSTDYKHFIDSQFDNGTLGPIEIGEGIDSYYYDQHYPTSTTSNACDISDYSNRTWIYSAHNANTRYRLKVWNDKIEQHKYDDDSLVASETFSWTTHSWYNGLYEMGLYTANSNLIWHAARFYDSDNNLTDEWLVQSDGSIKETLTQTIVQPQSVATGVTVSEYGNMTTYTYPTNYEQYDAPNLNYTECANEAAMKALSCPYEGMKVKLTDTGKKYKFTYNSTTSQYEWDEIASSLDVDLNNQWIASTKTLDGYKVYMSNSNHYVNNGYASMKFKFKGMPNFKLWINSYAESNYDYTVAYNLDVDYPTSNPQYNSTGVKANTRGKQYNPANGLTAFTEVDYSNDGGEHFVVVTFRKDSSVNSNDDRGYVAVKLMLISTTWVVSETEFIKKDDKYYEKLTEVGTYEGGFTANTGNYKEGNELTVTYKQGTADDYILVGSSMYYKKYAYVTPVNTEINTGDYIQGDYIGEATPSMKVTYNDGSNKTFYNLTSIEKDTDPNKSNAKNVEIYDSVTSIGDKAFYYCSNLTDITIPSGVTSIGQSAFNGCSSLTSVTIPESVTSIGNYSFQACSSLTSITIPDSVTSIGQSAFRDCNSLATVTIQSGVTSIGEFAFYGCSSLTSITIPNSVTSIGEYSFYDCSNLTGITIPNSVTSIGEWAFKACSSLTSITIPNSVTSIGNYAFYNCSSLTGITLSDNLTSIRQSAFNGCSSLTSVTIPESVTSIGNYSFQACSSLTSITIQNSTSKLAYNTDAFSNISSTAKLYVPSNLLSDYQSDSNWTNAFGGGIYAIGEQVITNAMYVEYNYGSDMFTELTSISENIIDEDNKEDVDYVTIYYGVTSIGDYAFQDFISLMDVRKISYSVKTIGAGAFWGCSGLYDITLPYYVTSIGKWAFSGCTHLTTITVQASTPPTLGTDAIPSNVTTIYVPASSVSTYKSASGWSAFASKIKAIGS